MNRLDEPVFMAVSKPMQTEFDIHHRLESCGPQSMVGETLFSSVPATALSQTLEWLFELTQCPSRALKLALALLPELQRPGVLP